MATGKSGVIEKIGTNGVTLKVVWNEEYDVSTNTSVVNITLYAKSSYYYGILYYPDGAVTVGGSNVITFNAGTGGYSYYNSSLNTYAQIVPGSSSYPAAPWGSVSIAHSSDGSGSTTLALDIYGITTSGNNQWHVTLNQSITLTTIPRASSVSSSGGYIGSALSIAINRATSSFTHTLTYAFGSASGTIVSNTQSTSVSWTPPMSLCSQLPSSSSGTCTITCKTYNGSTLIGTSTGTVTLAVPTSVLLEVSAGWAAIAYYNDGTPAAAIAAFVQGYSKVDVTFDISHISTDNAYGATIASYKITYNGISVNTSPYRTSIINEAGEISVTCTVIDSRGRSVSETLTVTVQAYSAPTLSGISVVRCTSDGTASESGTYVKVQATASYSSVNSLNSITLRARYKASGGTYGDYTTLTSGTALVTGSGAMLITSTYIVEVSVVDALSNAAVSTVYIPTADVSINIKNGGKAVGIGRYVADDDDGTFDVEWPAIFRNGLKIGSVTLQDYIRDMFFPVGSLYCSSVYADPSTFMGGTWEQIKDKFILAAGDTYAAGATGGAETQTISVANMPPHSHPFLRPEWYGWENGAGVSTIYGVTTATTTKITGSTDSAGGGEAFSIMPPYIAKYCWERTA